MKKWNQRLIELAHLVAGWSKDPSTKVGAVIVDPFNRVLSLGYNGFPRRVVDSRDRLEDRPRKYQLTVHAELNAILNAHAPLAGTRLYCTLLPCAECAKAIIQSGITHVICPAPPEGYERWADSWRPAQEMFLEAGVHVEILP